MKTSTLRRMRLVHLYLGLFFAPAILFFAFTGAFQTLELQDRSANYAPPRWIAVLASVHKHQALLKPKPTVHADHAKAMSPTPSPDVSTWPLKIFVLMLSLGLMLASLFGVIIALNTRSTRKRAIVILIVGVGLPLLLLL